MKRVLWLHLALVTIVSLQASAQHSVARKWNEVLLEGIRNDYARPVVHARNLFHISAAMYDAWSAYEADASTYLLGKTMNGYSCSYPGIDLPDDKVAAQEKAMSYAAYRIMAHRFANSPLAFETFVFMDQLMLELGYDKNVVTFNLESGDPAALGNYIAKCYIEYGQLDKANEDTDYANLFYSPVNEPLIPDDAGNSTLTDPNRWQPLTLATFIDQGGNEIPGATPEFLGPEWGQVTPFALSRDDLTIYERDGFNYYVYHDPGNPPYLQSDGSGLSAEYQWGFSLVNVWSSHLDPGDGVMWDISPGSSGNLPVTEWPTEWSNYSNFYNRLEGGDPSQGRSVNSKTGMPYESNVVPRGDYTRVLAEFWADGPDSETPPGHWFTILNYVNDQPELEKKYRGEGAVLSDLEWDIKAYFLLGGTMHDAAITAWGIKGYYDYIRPISAIRYMADRGQSSNPDLPNYAPDGMPLMPGYIELVEAGDPLAGNSNEHVNKIKVLAWRGPDYIANPETDMAGVGWILAENWWPYQRPTFITPNFAGYVSGHSTFSRAAAEVLTMLTGDEYFPGGMGEFHATANEFLVFEEGPSVDVTLQWATYRDASDQTSLSRIWGGIHPPADDINGRKIGIDIANDAMALADAYFTNTITSIKPAEQVSIAYPNPANGYINVSSISPDLLIELLTVSGKVLISSAHRASDILDLSHISPGTYLLQIHHHSSIHVQRLIVR